MKTIREMVKEIQSEVAKGDLMPGRAAELLNQLSALIGNVNEEIRDSDLAFNVILLAYLESETKANRAKIKAETSKEYLRKREARDTKELVIEMIRSLKYYLKAKEEERNISGYQS